MQRLSTVIQEKRGRYPPQRSDLPRFRYIFVDDVYTNTSLGQSRLLGKAKLLHEGLWLRIVTAEVAVDHGLVLCTTHFENVLAE